LRLIGRRRLTVHERRDRGRERDCPDCSHDGAGGMLAHVLLVRPRTLGKSVPSCLHRGVLGPPRATTRL
jgi:hypothetical protein